MLDAEKNEKGREALPSNDNSMSAPVLNTLIEQDDDTEPGEMSMQALRSASNWSLGKRNTECSIYQAYLGLIDIAEQYIYIENQFFISSTSNSGVENRLVLALFARI